MLYLSNFSTAITYDLKKKCFKFLHSLSNIFEYKKRVMLILNPLPAPHTSSSTHWAQDQLEQEQSFLLVNSFGLW